MNKIFRIGTFTFAMNYPEDFIPADNFMLFEVNHTDVPEYTYDIVLVDELDEPSGTEHTRREDLIVYREGTLENRLIGVKGNPEPYAYYHETDDSHALVQFARHRTAGLNIDPMFVSLLAMERRLINKEGIVLHCAYLDNGRKEAILFSANSGTGKSTQAGLWEKYREGSRQINGDKALLQKVEGVWTARSWPVCGSSEICRLQDTKIKAVVMLSQKKDNFCIRLTPMQAFSLIYPQITCNRWDKKANIKTMDLVDDLIRNVPVWHLGCNISEDAVRCLEEAVK